MYSVSAQQMLLTAPWGAGGIAIHISVIPPFVWNATTQLSTLTIKLGAIKFFYSLNKMIITTQGNVL